MAEHLDSAAQLALTVSKLAQLDERHRKIVVAAARVHDLNKLDPEERSVQKLARDPQFLKQTLAEAKVLDWLEDPEADLEIVRRLIERHSAHHISDGLVFFPEDPRIEQMASIVRAADLLDIGLEEGTRLRKLEAELGAVFQKPCQLFHVTLNEERGYLSALLLEAIDEVLTNHGLQILAHDPNGTLFMGTQWPETDLAPIVGQALEAKIQAVFSGNLDTLVQATKDGIKIQAEALKQDLGQILSVVRAHLEKKQATVKMQKLQSDVQKWAAKAGDEAIQAAEDAGLFPIQTPDDFAVSEALKAAYLSYRKANIDVEEAWKRLGVKIGLSEIQSEALQAFDGQYGRPLFAATSSRGLEAALVAVQDSLTLRQQQMLSSQETCERPSTWETYVHQAVSWPIPTPQNWQAFLNAYIDAGKDKRCSLGATQGEVQSLNSSDFPRGTKVQIFSNRLLGGRAGDPKRKGSQVAIVDYQLLTAGAALPKADAGTPSYAHLFLPQASSPSLKRALKDWILEQAQINPEGPISWDEKALYQKLELHFKANKVVGAALPRREAFVSNQVVFSLYWGKDSSDSLALLKSLRLVLELAVGLSLPFALSNHLEIEGHTSYFGQVAGIPSNLQTLLLRGQYKDWSDAQHCLRRLQLLGQIMDLCCQKWDKRDECLYDLATVLSSPAPLQIYSALLRWYLRTSPQADAYRFAVQKISPLLNELLEDLVMPEKSQLTPLLRQAAQLAVEANIRGKSFERNAIMDPVQHFLEVVRQQKPHHDLDFIFADLIQRYHNRLDRLREHGVGRTKLEQLKHYYSLFRQIYSEVYQGRPERLLPDEKALLNAYLFFFHEASQNLKQSEQNTIQTEEESQND